MKREGRNATRVVRALLCQKSLADILAGLYQKLHGVPRPVAMKKTVIKRRKRVPAVGASSGRGESVNPSQSENSPGNASVALPTTPQTAAISIQPTHDQALEAARPVFAATSNPPPAEHRGSPADSATKGQPISTSSDFLGLMRRPPQTAMPISIPARIDLNGSERKRPWWIDNRDREKEKEAKEREAREREGVSEYSCIEYSCRGGFYLFSLPFPFDPFVGINQRPYRTRSVLLDCSFLASFHIHALCPRTQKLGG